MNNNNHIFHFHKPTLVIGLGLSGYSCVKFLVNKKCPISVLDTREKPPFIDDLKTNYSDVSFICAEISEQALTGYEQIIVSPGISPRHPALIAAQKAEKLIIGDLNIFIQETETPVIAVTGSNGKSTVVSLLAHIINHCDKKAIAGGNLGLPLLDLLQYQVDYYIIELSSFQLETLISTKSNSNIKPFISASVLNVTEDHMDRYKDLQDYRETKQKIYKFAQYQVINQLDSHNTDYKKTETKQAIYFTEQGPLAGEFGLICRDKNIDIVSIDKETNKSILWANSETLKIKGRHNYLNIASTLALLAPLELDSNKVKQSLTSFEGLDHRCQWVANINNHHFYNDSKGTNVGATIAAINSFDDDIVLIAGGIGKDADFSPLADIIAKKVKGLILIGHDANLIKAAVESSITQYKDNQSLTIKLVTNLQKAVTGALEIASENAIVLFSPACASFDMFNNYVERGQQFVQEVKQLASELSVNSKVKETV
ncbi:MAG: UDP-N-acetylmuramoyl-L-alanine--D-glutamate ligase [Gammaproteobacteria bacterium]|nr:UDP-N-acetylmuramoyl-L-alanine--D-glutamate ligase [Gammaproteobacteria bacterium]